MSKFSVSERFACRVLGQHRSTQRKKPEGRPDEEALTADIIRLASHYGRYGYRRITAMLRSEGWGVMPSVSSASGGGGAEGSSEATQERAALAE